MKRSEALEAVHRASLAFSETVAEIQGKLPEISKPWAKAQLLEAVTRAEHALRAAYYTINDLYFPKGID